MSWIFLFLFFLWCFREEKTTFKNGYQTWTIFLFSFYGKLSSKNGKNKTPICILNIFLGNKDNLFIYLIIFHVKKLFQTPLLIIGILYFLLYY